MQPPKLSEVELREAVLPGASPASESCGLLLGMTAHFGMTAPLFLATLGRAPMLSPYVAIRPRRGAARAPGCRGRAAGRLAGSFAAELAIEQRLGADHEDDAHYLHAHREAEWSSASEGVMLLAGRGRRVT